jgi:hypothetical protein
MQYFSEVFYPTIRLLGVKIHNKGEGNLHFHRRTNLNSKNADGIHIVVTGTSPLNWPAPHHF